MIFFQNEGLRLFMESCFMVTFFSFQGFQYLFGFVWFLWGFPTPHRLNFKNRHLKVLTRELYLFLTIVLVPRTVYHANAG